MIIVEKSTDVILTKLTQDVEVTAMEDVMSEVGIRLNKGLKLREYNSLDPDRCGSNFRSIIFKLIENSSLAGLVTCSEIALR